MSCHLLRIKSQLPKDKSSPFPLRASRLRFFRSPRRVRIESNADLLPRHWLYVVPLLPAHSLNVPRVVETLNQKLKTQKLTTESLFPICPSQAHK